MELEYSDRLLSMIDDPGWDNRASGIERIVQL